MPLSELHVPLSLVILKASLKYEAYNETKVPSRDSFEKDKVFIENSSSRRKG